MTIPIKWHPSCRDVNNPMDYYIWHAVERDYNGLPHSTALALKAEIVDAMASFPNTISLWPAVRLDSV